MASVFTYVRCADAASQVQPISTTSGPTRQRLDGRARPAPALDVAEARRADHAPAHFVDRCERHVRTARGIGERGVEPRAHRRDAIRHLRQPIGRARLRRGSDEPLDMRVRQRLEAHARPVERQRMKRRHLHACNVPQPWSTEKRQFRDID